MSAWWDTAFQAADVILSPVSSLDRVTKGAVGNVAHAVLTPAYLAGKAVGDANPLLRKRAQNLSSGIRQNETLRDLGLSTPETMLMTGADIAAPVEAVPKIAMGTAKVGGAAVKAGLQVARPNMSIINGMVKGAAKLLKPGTKATHAIDISKGVKAASKQIIDTVGRVGTKAKINFVKDGKTLKGAEANKAWSEVRAAAKKQNSKNAKRTVDTVDSYRAAQKQAKKAPVQKQPAPKQKAKPTNTKPAPKQQGKPNPKPKKSTPKQKSTSSKGTSIFGAAKKGIGEVADATVKSAKSAWPWIATAGLVGAGATYLLTAPTEDEVADDAADDKSADDQQVPGPQSQSGEQPGGANVEDSGYGDVEDYGGSDAGYGSDVSDYGDDVIGPGGSGGSSYYDDPGTIYWGDYPLGVDPDPSVLDDYYGYFDRTGIGLLDAAVEWMNGALDQVGIDSDFKEGIREAIGMGPIAGPIVIVGGIGVAVAAAEYSGLLPALVGYETPIFNFSSPLTHGGVQEW